MHFRTALIVLVAGFVSAGAVPSNALETVDLATPDGRTLRCELGDPPSQGGAHILQNCRPHSDYRTAPENQRMLIELETPKSVVCGFDDKHFDHCTVVPSTHDLPTVRTAYSGKTEAKCKVTYDPANPEATPLIEKCKLATGYRHPKQDLTSGETLFFRGMSFKVEGGRTNEDGFSTDGVGIPLRFDDELDFWKVSIGYAGKPIVTDILRLFDAEAASDSKKGLAWRELMVDAFKLDLQIGVGRTAKRLRDGNRNLEDRTSWRVKASYELPLEAAWAHARRAICTHCGR